MISWLLAVVLLFAPAITTPTSTEPTQATGTTPPPSLPPSTTTTAGAHQLHQHHQQRKQPHEQLGSSVAPSELFTAQTGDGFAKQDLGGASRNLAAATNESPSSKTTNLMFEYPTLATTTATTTHTNTTPKGANINNNNNKFENVINDKEDKLPNKKKPRQQPIFTNQFVIQVEGGEKAARELAEKHGFIYLNHILDNFYHLEHRRLAKRSLDATDISQLDTSIEDEPQVIKFERQVLKKRVKRDFLDLGNPPATTNSGPDNSAAHNYKQHQQPQQRNNNNRQLLRPIAGNQQANGAANRPANSHQFTRPANQLPTTSGQQQQHHHHTSPGTSSHIPPPHRSFEANQPNRRPTPSAASPSAQLYHSSPFSVHTNLAHRTNLGGALNTNILDALDGASSGPLPFFVQPQAGNSSSSSSSLNHKQRPLPAPIVLSAGTSSSATNNMTNMHDNRASAGHHYYANQTAQPAPFSDPSWPLMWYLDGGARNGFDLNVQAAWRMGYTGKGIVITILDDGLEKDHPDLQANYDPLASFDINSDDADPMPRYDPNDSNRHGTRCAGEVAAVPGNNICSIGIAYNSKVGGVRMLDGDVTDAVEARSLGLNSQHIHIYSASWGPDDNGKTVDGPGEMATRAFIEGVTNGRQGLGSIFVFASGNGGREHDNCNCDGYTNSIWTLSISSATENGYVPWYIEACSSTLATTYSSGSYDERQIATTDIRHSCTSNHTGTSASAPLAAGICALVLESNPRLTWRDMQHIVVRTAKPANLLAKDWRTNALGRNVSHAFGYGLMDAAGMITMAKQWTTVPVQYTCEVRSPQMEKYIPPNGYIELKLRAECANVRFLEHVQSKVTLTASRRGDLHIYLTSPLGTRSTLLAQRPNDQAEQGFRNWPFMTVHSWGEPPNGIWTLEVHNDGKPQNRAYLKEWTLILYGTSEDPNRHLDPVSLATSVPMAATPAPPNQQRAPSATSSHQMPSGRLPVTAGGGNLHSSVPPPPSFAPTSSSSSSPSSSHQGAEIESIVAHKKPPQSQSPLPPPLPPGHLPPPARPTQSPSGSTSTSSSANNERPSSSGGNRFGINQQQQQQQQQLQPMNSNNGHMTKPDFEVVAPPAGSGGRLTNHWMSGANDDHDHDNHQPTTTTTATSVTTTTTTSSTQTTPGVQNNGQHFDDSNRPPTVALNDNNENSNQNQIIKPSIDQIDAQLATNRPTMTVSNYNHNNEQQHRQPAINKNNHNDGLDTNQLDSKLTKDYRSSGGQQQHQQPTTTTTNTNSIEDNEPNVGYSSSSINTSTTQQQQGSSAASTTAAGWPLQAALALVVLSVAFAVARDNTNPIVRIRQHKLTN